MTIVINAPDYYEEAGWPKSKWDAGNFEAQRRLICAWDDRDDLLSWIGTPPNDKYPYAEGPEDAVAFQATVDPIGQQGTYSYAPNDGQRPRMTLAAYTQARVTVKYSTLAPKYLGRTLVSSWIMPDMESHVMDHDQYRWDSNTGTVLTPGEAPYNTRYGLQYVIRYHREPNVPTWVLTRVGTCNANIVHDTILGIRFAPQTLLYQPPTIRNTYTMGLLNTYEVTVRYKYHPVGWNTFWRQSSMAYEAIYLAGGEQYIQYPPIVY